MHRELLKAIESGRPASAEAAIREHARMPPLG
jgi:DNA-binding GntR family transcriptional regulator